MSIRLKILLPIVVLLLPLSMIGLVRWIPPIEDLSFAFVVILLVWIIGLILLLFFTRRLRHVYRDYAIGFTIVSVFSFFPIAALVVWINQGVVWNQQKSPMEVVTRFHPPGSGHIYLHLWDAHQLRSQRVAMDGPASTAQPGDSVTLTINKGLLGITYVKHADIVR